MVASATSIKKERFGHFFYGEKNRDIPNAFVMQPDGTHRRMQCDVLFVRAISIGWGILALLAGILCMDLRPAYGDMQVTCPALTAQVSFRPFSENQLQVRVLDQQGEPIAGLGVADFVIKRDGKTARTLSVTSLLTEKSVGLDIVVVVDNSSSMKQRKAIEPLVAALDTLLEKVRPIDQVTMIVFDENNRIRIGGRELRLARFQSNNTGELKYFLRKSYEKNLTNGTYLYDAMYAGIETIRGKNPDGNAYLIVFSDGEEINSTVKGAEVASAARDVDFTAYAVDYMPKDRPDPFLESFAASHNGKVWKAGLASELTPIFQAVSTTMFQRYIVTYRFFDPPSGSVSMAPETIIIEDVTAIDSSPLLNYIFFDTAGSTIPDRYLLYADPAGTGSFDMLNLRDTMAKYRHVLDVIGKRMTDHTDARLELVGCNSNFGEEKKRIDLSQSRVDAVAAYLQRVWGIGEDRIKTSARNLPAIPATSREPEGREENQRVEINSRHPAILATVNSNYVQKMSPSKTIRIQPRIQAEAGIDRWRIVLKGDGETVISKIEGNGQLPAVHDIPLDSEILDRIADFVYVNVGIEVVDREGEVFSKKTAAISDISFERREEILAKKRGHRVFEKYALILFDFDSWKIKNRNREIVDRIVTRIGELPHPRVTVTGHTDTIGSEEYNLTLSKRRARAVYDTLVAALGKGADVTYTGLGEDGPIYDNELPEGRALNRTVTVVLEYEVNQ